MKVILREDVDKVGLRGEVVDVARGFARNYLLPRRLAEPATDARVTELEKVNANRARHEAQDFEQAQEIAQRLGQLELRFDVKAGETGVLFGSVTATDVADTLWDKHKIRVDRRKIELAEAIKRIGRYEIPVELFADVVVPVRTLVVPEGGELPPEIEEPEPGARARGAGRRGGGRGAGRRGGRGARVHGVQRRGARRRDRRGRAAGAAGARRGSPRGGSGSCR